VLFEEGHRLLLCRGCGLAFVDGSPRDFDDYYSRQYDPGLEDRPAVHERALRWVSRHLPAGGGLSLLEIGCGFGHLLVRLRERGFRVAGIEPNERAAAYARDAQGLTVACSTVERLAGPVRDQSYDAVLMIQTLEHLPDPLAALSTVRSLMASDGRLFVEVPHYFSPIGLYRPSANGRYIPSGNHLFVYSAETLTAFMKRAGLDVVSRARTWADLRIIARPSLRAHSPASPPPRRRAYWQARAFHLLMPLQLRAVDAAKGVRRVVRRLWPKEI
jgi:2-polyprenyl-3-methyl-5-hydroxy-6-metoxy-1,4-benzoquinol methylase